jgi:predicted Zn-dependent protease
MTKRREMGNAALEAINQAAEDVNEAATALEKLISANPDWPTLLITVARIIIRLQKALRRLESIGAKTRP